MTTQQREIFRDTILRSMKAWRNGIAVASLDVALRACGFNKFSDDEIEEDLIYFSDKGFVTEVAKSHSVGNKLWRITAAGVDDLERRGL